MRVKAGVVLALCVWRFCRAWQPHSRPERLSGRFWTPAGWSCRA